MNESLLYAVRGFMYPNEVELQWSILIVLYPFITGLVAGAFILASLERVFNVQAVKPTYRLALLTSLSFLLVATLPLLAVSATLPELAPAAAVVPAMTSRPLTVANPLVAPSVPAVERSSTDPPVS